MTRALETAVVWTLLATWLGGCGTTQIEPGDAPDARRAPPVSEVDLLLLVDDSHSMEAEQALLVRELPTLVRGIVTGDLDDDGTADVEGATSLHVGVVTPDLGTGPVDDVPTCLPGLGDDGVLHGTTAACSATHASGVFAFVPLRDDAAEFLETIACVAEVGTGGCGFEQQLEATLKALTPSEARAWTRDGYAPPRFLDARNAIDAEAGQGERANAGFLRPDSVLAIVLLTDEEDCSVSDYGLFSRDDPRFVDDPRFTREAFPRRCIVALDPSIGLVRPLSRYADGLLGLRRHPEDLVFAAIVGMPQETEPDAGESPEFDAILTHPRMIGYPPMGVDAEQACAGVSGLGVAGRRFVELARDLFDRGASVALGSVCSESYEAPMASVLRLVGARLPRR